MTKNWLAINAVLLLLSGFLGWRLYTSAKTFRLENDVAKIQPSKDPKNTIALEAALAPVKPPVVYNPADFAIIPAQTIFSDTRAKEEAAAAAPVVAEAPPLQVKPILVGVTLVGEQKLASVIDPVAPNPARRSTTKRLGDSFQGYIITDITRDQLVLERGSRREVIPLFDSSKHPAQGTAAQGGRTPILPTRIVAIGGGGSSGQGAAQPVQGGQRPVPASAASGAAQAGAPAVQPPGRNPTQPGRQVSPASQTAPTPSPTDQQGRRVIRTPFGDVPVRPDP
jgi:hypothetical protein